MHSKVIITALIFGLAVGFTSGGMNDVKATKSLAKNDVCDVVEPAGKALRSLQPRKAAAASTTVRPDLFITRSRTDTFNSGGDWYTFTAPFSGRFWFESTSSNVDPIAQIYLGKGTSYGTVSPDAGNRDDISSSDRNFRFALDMTCGTTYYIQVTEYYGPGGEEFLYVLKVYLLIVNGNEEISYRLHLEVFGQVGKDLVREFHLPVLHPALKGFPSHPAHLSLLFLEAALDMASGLGGYDYVQPVAGRFLVLAAHDFHNVSGVEFFPYGFDLLDTRNNWFLSNVTIFTNIRDTIIRKE